MLPQAKSPHRRAAPGEPIHRQEMTELRHRQSNKPTEDRKLLMQRPFADTSFLESDAWRALRIQGEFVDGFDPLARRRTIPGTNGRASSLASSASRDSP